MTVKHFLNLTNGLGWAPQLAGDGIDWQYVRIKSTTVERKNWIKLFGDLDHNFLMSLATGDECVVYDMGCRRPNSKVIYYAVPFIRYTLNRLWHGLTPDNVVMRRSVSAINVRPHFESAYKWLLEHSQNKYKGEVKSKLKYYLPLLAGQEVSLRGESTETAMDGNKQWFNGQRLSAEAMRGSCQLTGATSPTYFARLNEELLALLPGETHAFNVTHGQPCTIFQCGLPGVEHDCWNSPECSPAPCRIHQQSGSQ